MRSDPGNLTPPGRDGAQAERRGRWFRPARVMLPTWRTWLLLLVTGACGLTWAGRNAHEFLAISRPVATSVLVVEGWLPDYAVAYTIEEFKRGGYQLLITSGGPIERGAFLSEYGSHAALTAATLVRMGMDPARVAAAPADAALRNRTWASAVAVRDWLAANGMGHESVNVVSLGAHARRSLAVYRKVFGDGWAVGTLAVPDRDVDPAGWWRTSQGVKVTAVELLGWLYEVVAESGRIANDATTSHAQSH
ncbi:MAG: YdcF family protein [Pseudomonadales bacterium]|nr:YdcF family protein [Pseudomonadales bacterium]